MSDFADSLLLVPERMTLFDRLSCATPLQSLFNQPWTSLTLTANRALYLPVVISQRYPVARVFWVSTATVAGNVDVGFYTVAGARIWSTGGVSGGSANACNFSSVSPTMILNPGGYFFAFASANATSSFNGAQAGTPSAGRVAGFYQQDTAYPLPATATFAAWNSSVVPLFGIAASASGV